ncbi:tRNA (5-methylaminomethyl-2-thiouridine)(34)-methyltransferase MnmD [Amylibacter sp.]|nr:tRNA (5-methylaminomethyl-2-thiouridine)(34)-methyltransferase MnmD [Amylibacter sp.]
MCDQIKNASLKWHNKTIPISTVFDDSYFSIYDGLAETKHVFLSGNNLSNRFKKGFHVAELGFGSGLNLLATWQLWLKSGQTTPLKFTSFEAFPMALKDMEQALESWPELNHFAAEMLKQLENGWTINTTTLNAEIIIGDARNTLKSYHQLADAWFLDGFSPAKNPEMWEKNLLTLVADHTSLLGTFSTYTAAGFVRRHLTQAGFEVERIKGFNKKRHMSIGYKL